MIRHPLTEAQHVALLKLDEEDQDARVVGWDSSNKGPLVELPGYRPTVLVAITSGWASVPYPDKPSRAPRKRTCRIAPLWAVEQVIERQTEDCLCRNEFDEDGPGAFVEAAFAAGACR